MLSIILAVALQLIRGGIPVSPSLKSVVEPAPPLTSIEGSSVLVNATVNPQGRVQEIAILEGMNPFNDATTRAIRQWEFRPAQVANQAVESRVGVLAIYRPAAFGNLAVGGPALGFKEPMSGDATRPALPLAISDPGYPPASTAMGVVVLELSIDKNGVLSAIRTVRDVPTLTIAARDAIQEWKFSPALESNQPVDGILIVVVSYLRPVLAIP